MKVNLFMGETGYYEFAGYTGPSPDIEVRIGQTYTFDQTDPSNWYHAVGFAYFPDGAHGETWGGDERDEVEGLGELLYKINGAATTCPDAGDTGLDCYEPEFFYPRGDWMAKNYTAELTITQAMADRSHGGVIYYFLSYPLQDERQAYHQERGRVQCDTSERVTTQPDRGAQPLLCSQP